MRSCPISASREPQGFLRVPGAHAMHEQSLVSCGLFFRMQTGRYISDRKFPYSMVGDTDPDQVSNAAEDGAMAQRTDSFWRAIRKVLHSSGKSDLRAWKCLQLLFLGDVRKIQTPSTCQLFSCRHTTRPTNTRTASRIAAAKGSTYWNCIPGQWSDENIP